MRKISDFNSATEKYPVVYAGSASRPEYVDMPTILQQQEGTAPMDTLPAQWWNAMWKLATKDINAFRDYVGDAFTEINNLLTKFGITLDNADTEQLYDFFHDEYVQNYISTFFLSKNGGTVDGDLHIKGDLSVDGIGEEIISTELKVGANTITLRNDNPSALGSTELAGVVTENYDGNNHNNIISVDKNGVARTGDIDIATRILYSNDATNFYTDEELTIPATIGATEEVRDTGNQTSGGVEIYEGITYSNNDTQAIATREDNPVDGAFMKWDAASKKLVSASANIQFDIAWPIGVTYPQYPGCKSPNELWGQYSTWVELDFGGAFFRSNGGNASAFEASKVVSSINGTSITIANHGLTVGSVLYDKAHNESRVVTAVTNINVVVVNAAFSSSDITNLLITQNSQNLSHLHSIASHTHTLGGSTGNAGSHNHTTISQSENKTPATEGTHGHTIYVSNNGSQRATKTYVAANDGGASDYGGSNLGTATGSVAGGTHQHTYSHTHTTSTVDAHNHSLPTNTGGCTAFNSGSSGDTESRPIDFTFKIWKRIA